MEAPLLAAAALCVLVGLSLSLLGGGGAVLLVPLLVYVGRVPAKEAIAISLLLVGLSSALGSIPYFRGGFVNLRLAVLFLVPGIAAAFVGARFSESVPADILLLIFGILMMTISVILYRKSNDCARIPEKITCRPHAAVSAGTGAGIGFLTGLVGVGGGFLIVPAITILMRCSVYTAIGTSLAIISVNSLTGFAGHLSHLRLDPGLTALLLSAMLLGTLIGSRLGKKFSTAALQKGFAVLIFAVGLVMAVQHFFIQQAG